MKLFADRTSALGGPGTEAWTIHYEAMVRVRRGEDVILLTVGDPDTGTPAAITSAAKASLDRGRTHYAEVVGQADLRRAIAGWHERTTGQAVDPGQVVVVAGAQCGLFAALQCVVGPGDEVVAFQPAYVTYPATIAATGAVMVPCSLRAENGFHLDPADLDAAIGPRTRALLWNSPNNPTGAVATPAEIEALAERCRRHDLWLVTDEVYASLVFDGRHRSPAALPGMAERAVIVSSLSKSHAMTGWRLGWVIGPEAFARHAGNLVLAMLYGSPPFIQDAAVAALTGPDAERTLMCERYRNRRDAVVRRLDGVARLRLAVPAAGMFVMLDVRGTGLSSEAFARALLAEEAVAVLAGDAFGPPAAGHVRISLTVPDDRLALACERIAGFAARCRAEAA